MPLSRHGRAFTMMPARIVHICTHCAFFLEDSPGCGEQKNQHGKDSGNAPRPHGIPKSSMDHELSFGSAMSIPGVLQTFVDM